MNEIQTEGNIYPPHLNTTAILDNLAKHRADVDNLQKIIKDLNAQFINEAYDIFREKKHELVTRFQNLK